MQTKGNLYKKLFATTALASILCGHFENTEARLTAAVHNSTPMVIMLNQPALPAAPAGALLTACNV